MSCNPFASLTSKYSDDIINPDNIVLQAIDDIVEYNANPAFKYGTESVKQLTRDLNSLLATTDIRNFDGIRNRLERSPLSFVEIAQMLDETGLTLQQVQQIVAKEKLDRGIRTPSDTGAIGDFSIVTSPNDVLLQPGVYENITVKDSERPAKFTVIVNSNGIPIILNTNKGRQFKPGENVSLIDTAGVPYSENMIPGIDYEETGIVIEIQTTESIFDVSLLPEDISPSPPHTFVGDTENISERFSFSDLLGLIDKFFTLLNKFLDKFKSFFDLSFLGKLLTLLQHTIQKATDIGNFWDNFENMEFNLPAILDAVKQQLDSMIDQIVESLKNQVDAMKTSVFSTGSVNAVSSKQPQKQLLEMENFLRDENVEGIKKLGDYTMDRTQAQFESSVPMQDVLTWIADRMNHFVDSMAEFLNNPMEKVTQSVQSHLSTFNTLQANSSEQYMRISSAGGLRLPYEQGRTAGSGAVSRARAANPDLPRVNRRVEEQGPDIVSRERVIDTPAGPRVIRERFEVSQIDTPAGRRTVENRVETDLDQFRIPPNSGYAAKPISSSDFSQMNSAMSNSGWSGYLNFAPGVAGDPGRIARGLWEDREGNEFKHAPWKMIQKEHPEIWVMIKNVAEALGRQLTINSAYRSPRYNRSLSGAATNSLHIQAKALDVSMSGVSDRSEFVKLAKAEGFKGIGYYRSSNFIHVDTGRERSWGTPW